jgi:hypothetical protein
MLAMEVRLALVVDSLVMGSVCIPGAARADVKTVNVVSPGGQGANLFIPLSCGVEIDQGCSGSGSSSRRLPDAVSIDWIA